VQWRGWLCGSGCETDGPFLATAAAERARDVGEPGTICCDGGGVGADGAPGGWLGCSAETSWPVKAMGRCGDKLRIPGNRPVVSRGGDCRTAPVWGQCQSYFAGALGWRCGGWKGGESANLKRARFLGGCCNQSASMRRFHASGYSSDRMVLPGGEGGSRCEALTLGLQCSLRDAKSSLGDATRARRVARTPEARV
jgi:hypothetical protein